MKNKGDLGLYLHVPFCKSKCAYCDFYSLPHAEDRMDDYLRALTGHLIEVAPRFAAQRVDTVYIGGGTPSYFGTKRLEKLLGAVKKHYSVDKNTEVTVEMNPDSVGSVKELKGLCRAGVTRVSLGMQAADDETLRNIGRIHTAEQVRQAVKNLREAGIKNLSLDLIYGLPGQSRGNRAQTLQAALALAPEHLSCYGLKVEEGTPLAERDNADLPDDDAQADMYLTTVETLEMAGYGQYEISNFARAGYESRHNLRYWQMKEYLGFGPGAHSDVNGVRFAYEKDLAAYIRGDWQLSEREELPPLERDMEYIMLSLRTTAGIDRDFFENTYRQSFAPMEKLFETYETHGLAKRTEKGWRLTPKGFFVSNSIIVALQEAVGEEKMRKVQQAHAGNFRIV